MDDVAKRREARRRKILENSQNRLNRISGVEQNSTHFVCENHEDSSESSSKDEVNDVREVRPQTVVKQAHKQYRKIVISALAVFINVLLLIVDKSFDAQSTHLNKIFVPLLVYEVIELMSNQQRTKNLSFIYVLLAASVKNSHISSVIRYLELISNVFQDVMVYFFVFVCCDFMQYLLQVR